MAEVYVARRQGEAQGVALKVFTGAPWTPSRRRRFEREARAIGALDHPNVVRMISFHADEFGGAVATELLEGEDLRGRLNRAPLPFDAVLEMAAGIAGGLAAAHHAGIVHRDLKPENVFITEAGAIKLLDFGLAKMVGEKPARGPEDQSATSKPGELMGTPAYMSPEQVRTEGIGPSSDVFAFGSLLYEMLTGRPPFLRDTAIDTMFAVAHESPEPLPAAAAAFSAVMDKCLKKAWSERYASGGQLLAALTALR
jgi:serine/threonine protein kinase